MLASKYVVQTRCLIFVLLLSGPQFWIAPGLGDAAAAEVTRVENSDKPAQGIHRIELEELWRVGGDDDDHLFGIINRASEGGFFILRALRYSGKNLVAAGVQQSVNQSTGKILRRNFISTLLDDGSLGAVYAENEHAMDLNDMKLDEIQLIESPDSRFDVTPEGKVVAAIPRYGYEVSVFNQTGNLELVFSRLYESWKRDAEAENLWRKVFEVIQRTEMPGAPIQFEEYQPDIEVLQVADDGSIWILTSRAMWDSPDGIFTSYDVFSPDGKYQKKLDFICEGSSRKDLLFLAGGDRVFVVKGFWDAAMSRIGAVKDNGEEPEPMSVVCYKMR